MELEIAPVGSAGGASIDLKESQSGPVTAPNISLLPADVIQMIIRCDRSSVQSSRLISRRWNEQAVELLSSANRELRGPTLDAFVFDRRIGMTASIPMGYRNFFGLDSWREGASYEQRQVEEFMKAIVPRTFPVTSLTRLFARCSSVARMEINGLVGRLTAMRQALGGAEIAHLVVRQWDAHNHCDFIVDFARAHNVKHLELHETIAWSDDDQRIGKIITDAMRAVPRLVLVVDCPLPVDAWKGRMVPFECDLYTMEAVFDPIGLCFCTNIDVKKT